VDFDGDVRQGIRHYHSYFEERQGPNLELAPRAGDGRARISAVWFSDSDGNRLPILNSGQNVQLHICVDPAARNCRNLHLAVGITTLRGEGILHLSTETYGLPVEQLERRKVFTCDVPKLPLRKGYYSMNLFLSSGGTVCDWLQDALRFQVADADFYGTGRLPPDGYSAFLADFSWSVA
jgi:lipopolysaccharide transport system ATP-binding protein